VSATKPSLIGTRRTRLLRRLADAVAGLASAHGASGWWFAFVPPAGCAMWFGVVSARYPDRLASLGDSGASLAVRWGVLLLLVAWGLGFFLRPVRHLPGSTPT
jgi:hypothetical protein